MKELSKKKLIERDTLKDVADRRLAEARVLFGSQHYSGAIYLAGYAVECYLKYAVCRALNWDHLYGEFGVHDLEGLVLYSGLDKELRENREVYEVFEKVKNAWQVDFGRHVRYGRPGEFDKKAAEEFLKYVGDEKIGVVPWLQSRVYT